MTCWTCSGGISNVIVVPALAAAQNAKDGQVRMDHQPGTRIPVKHAQLQLDAPATP
jgi:uncharacterized protein YcfJ